MEQHSVLDQLHLPKQETGRRLSTSTEGLRARSARKVRSLENEVKALLDVLRTAIEADEHEIEQALIDRTTTVLTSAIMLGIIIGGQ